MAPGIEGGNRGDSYAVAFSSYSAGTASSTSGSLGGQGERERLARLRPYCGGGEDCFQGVWPSLSLPGVSNRYRNWFHGT